MAAPLLQLLLPPLVSITEVVALLAQQIMVRLQGVQHCLLLQQQRQRQQQEEEEEEEEERQQRERRGHLCCRLLPILILSLPLRLLLPMPTTVL